MAAHFYQTNQHLHWPSPPVMAVFAEVGLARPDWESSVSLPLFVGLPGPPAGPKLFLSLQHLGGHCRPPSTLLSPARLSVEDRGRLGPRYPTHFTPDQRY